MVVCPPHGTRADAPHWLAAIPTINARLMGADVPRIEFGTDAEHTRRDHWHRLKAGVRTVVSHECSQTEQNHPCVPSSSNVAGVVLVSVEWHFGHVADAGV
jgi:hypothetical protein